MSLLWDIGTNCACTHTYIPVSTMLQVNVMHLNKLLLTGYQFSSVRIPIEYVGRVTQCSISSFETAGLWQRSGYRGGRLSETKVNALAYREDRVKAVVIGRWSSMGCHCIFKIFHRCFVNIYRYGFKYVFKKWRLEINEFRSYCDVHISWRFVFFCSSFFVLIIQILQCQFVHLLFPF